MWGKWCWSPLVSGSVTKRSMFSGPHSGTCRSLSATATALVSALALTLCLYIITGQYLPSSPATNYDGVSCRCGLDSEVKNKLSLLYNTESTFSTGRQFSICHVYQFLKSWWSFIGKHLCKDVLFLPFHHLLLLSFVKGLLGHILGNHPSHGFISCSSKQTHSTSGFSDGCDFYQSQKWKLKVSATISSPGHSDWLWVFLGPKPKQTELILRLLLEFLRNSNSLFSWGC